MTPNLKQFIARVQGEMPGYAAVVRPYCSPDDDDDLAHVVYLLCVPEESLFDVTYRAFEIADEVFGGVPLPVTVIALEPEDSAERFPDQIHPVLPTRVTLSAAADWKIVTAAHSRQATDAPYVKIYSVVTSTEILRTRPLPSEEVLPDLSGGDYALAS